jgi:hypothetical protein
MIEASHRDIRGGGEIMMRKKSLLAGAFLSLVLFLVSCGSDSVRLPEFGDRVENEGVGNFDWNNAAKILLSNGLGEVPYVGWLIESMVEIYWPDEKPNVWDEVRQQVKILIDKEITDNDFNNLSEELQGLNNVIQSYLMVLKDSASNPQDISDAYEVAYGLFLDDLPTFEAVAHSESDRVAFLPLFAQFANMHLALQRDGVLYGKEWGWTDGKVADRSVSLTESIQQYVEFANTTIADGRKELSLPKVTDNTSATKRWKIENRYYRGMTLLVSDFVHIWPYFDPTKYTPEQVTSAMTCPRREIYSDPYGLIDIGNDPKGASFPTDWAGEHPPKMITQIEIWGYELFDAARVWYGGVAAAKMGGSGGSSAPPHGGTFTIEKTNPLTAAWGYSGDIIGQIGFTYKDGKKTPAMPKVDYPNGSNRISAGPYDGHILSSINIPGVSGYYQTADAVVFGFRIEGCYQPDEQ